LFDELSAGIILVRNISNYQTIEVLLLLHTAGHWDFPKGNLELRETELEAAIRELKEETGIVHFRLFPNFRYIITYRYRRNQRLVSKKVTYFLCVTDIKDVLLSNEHVDYRWEQIDRSMAYLKYKNARKSLESARNFIMTKNSDEIYY